MSGGSSSTSVAGRMVVVRRLSWGVADQGMSSLGNFALGIVVAKSLDPAGFGAFTLAFVTYGVVLNASRGVAADPLLVRFSGLGGSEAWRDGVRGATGTAVVAGLGLGLVCVGVGLLLPGLLSGAFVALGVFLPALLLQDSWRFAFFAAGRPAGAFLNDLLWTVLQLGGVIALYVTGRSSVFTCLVAFGGSAAVAAAFGFWQLKIRPAPRRTRGWLTEHRDLGPRYVMENVSISAARQIRMMMLGMLAGLAAVGQVRAAEMIMGPFLVILMGVSQVAVPEAAHVLQRRPGRLMRFCFGLGAVQAVPAVAWAAGVQWFLPDSMGTFLLSSLWAPALALLPPVAINFAFGAFQTGAAAGLRALGNARRSLAAQLLSAALYVILGIFGAAVGGAAGSCWGVAVATTLGAAIWWLQLHRGLGEHLRAQAR